HSLCNALLEPRGAGELGVQVHRVAVTCHGGEPLTVALAEGVLAARLPADFQGGVGRIGECGHHVPSVWGAAPRRAPTVRIGSRTVPLRLPPALRLHSRSKSPLCPGCLLRSTYLRREAVRPLMEDSRH